MNSNDELVNYLKDRGYIETSKVEEAFRSVNRGDFVDSPYAYADRALSIGEDATISAPHMVAKNTELLEVEKDSRVLEIGSGSGYQLAILSELADEAVGVEIEEELVEKSRRNLEDYDAEVLHGSGLDPVKGVFDRILYSCAVENFSAAKDYLADNGIILAPVIEADRQLLKKYRNGETTEHVPVRFVEFKEKT
ncbi:MAG: protein-L-isoaspartate O-methyltransferase [Candidatus Nanohaloarchaea archaeon]